MFVVKNPCKAAKVYFGLNPMVCDRTAEAVSLVDNDAAAIAPLR